MNKIKALIIGIGTAVTGWLGVLAIPVYILAVSNVIDYITGIVAAKNRGKEISSYYGMMGIVKKVFMYLLILIGAFVDIMLNYITAHLSDALHVEIRKLFFVGAVVAVWLVFNEFISILENLSDIGVPMPPFLMPLIKRIKLQVEESTEKEEEE